MIKKQFLFPECYINKVPYCDKCKVQLWNTNTELLTSPPIKIFQCPKCKEKYNIRADELQGEWKIVKIKTIRVLEEIIDE